MVDANHIVTHASLLKCPNLWIAYIDFPFLSWMDKSHLWWNVKPAPYEVFMGEVNAGRGRPPQKEIDVLWTWPKISACPAPLWKNCCPCILESHLFSNLILSALHFQGLESNMYVHFHWVYISNWLRFHFRSETVNKACKYLGSLKYYKTLVSIEVMIIVTCHWKGLCHSKNGTKNSIYILYVYFIIV